MNSLELKAQMIRKGKTSSDMCAAIGISASSWYRKIDGSTQFTQGEIIAIRKLLDLNDEQTGIIFFSDECPK